MMEKLANTRLIIPDAKALISLAHDDLLHVLLDVAGDEHIVTTDVVEFEVTRIADSFDANKISDFFIKNKDRVLVASTGFDGIIAAAKANPDMKLPKSLSETSIYGFVNDILRETPDIPTIILLDDGWFVKNTIGSSPDTVHLMSVTSFLKYVEEA